MLSSIIELKGEFEAEGLTVNEIYKEKLYALRNNRPYLVKIGGCEARSDMEFCKSIGVESIVAPMIESEFAMKKYMQMVGDSDFESLGVTIETKTAVENIENILNEGNKLTNVTVGRTDLSSSYDINDVEDDFIISKVIKVGRAAKNRGLTFTMGGSISLKTIDTLKKYSELYELIDHVETRKCVMSKNDFVESPELLKESFRIENELLEIKGNGLNSKILSITHRKKQIEKRLK